MICWCAEVFTGFIDTISEGKRFTILFTLSNSKSNDKVIFNCFVNWNIKMVETPLSNRKTNTYSQPDNGKQYGLNKFNWIKDFFVIKIWKWKTIKYCEL